MSSMTDQIRRASLGELRAVAHALCDERYKKEMIDRLRRRKTLTNREDQTTNHVDLIEQATIEDLMIIHSDLCAFEPVRNLVKNYLQVLRYAKPAEVAIQAAEPRDLIKDATAKQFHGVMFALCQSNEIKKRVVTHLRAFKMCSSMSIAAFIAVADPDALVNAATETELHAIGLAMCEGDEDMRKRVSECLRALAIFAHLQDG